MPSSSTSQNVADENDSLIRALKALSKKDKRLVKSSVHVAPADPTVKVRSWKMNEYKYAVHPSPFPTLARGLFTRWVSGKDATETRIPNETDPDGEAEGTGGQHTIVARGYDKFFNIGEVPWNTWAALEKYTAAPYYLTLKSNGCIIFIAALSPENLIVTSKHSLGQVSEGQTSHAMMGEQWLLRHLASKGKTKEDLAVRLHADNITAVAELCDDSFEEHVLGYPPELTGLHLHGLNKNQGLFSTAPPAEVDAFAAEYGFIQTASFSLPAIKEVREFTDKTGESGKWQGEPVEGFVVRTSIAPSISLSSTGSNSNSGDARPPYPPGSDFFFKVKFDEPYLMYRAWREITKTILAYKAKSPAERSKHPLSIPRSRLERPESRLYRDWVEKEIDARPADFKDFSKGRNIITTRDRFLRWLETDEGRRLERNGERSLSATKGKGQAIEKEKQVWGETVIVPVAVPGSGKTAVSVALARLFGFGHTQSDDIKSKKTAPTFQRNIAELLKTHDVVIADRNNHLSQHRQGIREALSKVPGGPVRTIALYWSLQSLPIATLHRICSDRILRRGENHQTLRPSEAMHEDVIWQFITNTEELGVDEVDDIIEMNIQDASVEDAVTRAVDGLLPLLPSLQRPQPTQIAEACGFALGYRTTVRKESDSKGKKPARPRYFGLLAEVDLAALIDRAFLKHRDDPDEPEPDSQIAQDFWSCLVAEGRVATRPHVTIVHSKDLPDAQSLWDACDAVSKSDTTSTTAQKLIPAPLFEYTLGHLICDGRVMAIAIDALHLHHAETGADAAKPFLALLDQDFRNRLHITVGTKNKDVAAVEGGRLVTRWRAGEEGIHAIPLFGEGGVGRVKGLS